MKILLCGVFSYYGRPGTHDTLYYYFNDTLLDMGYETEAIDTFVYGYSEEGRKEFNDHILNKVKKNNYGAMIIATYGHEFYSDILDEIRKYTALIAWNSDDDFRWDDYSKNLAPHFDLMYTTYKDIYDNNKSVYSNLRLSQWACLERYNGKNRDKVIPFSFVGQTYGDRLKNLYILKRKVGLRSWGRGTYQITNSYYFDKAIRGVNLVFGKLLGRRFIPDNFVRDFEEVLEIWSTSKISLNLLRSANSNKMQIKGRTFEMGLTGTVLISEVAPNMELYYEPDKEFLSFSSLDEVVDKVRYYLNHENELAKVAEAYYRRTKKEHLWRHRMEGILKDAGIRK